MSIQQSTQITLVAVGSRLANKKIVLTGKAESYTWDELHTLIIALGAVTGCFGCSKIDYLICCEKFGIKLDKARSVGVNVITLEEFILLQA